MIKDNRPHASHFDLLTFALEQRNQLGGTKLSELPNAVSPSLPLPSCIAVIYVLCTVP